MSNRNWNYLSTLNNYIHVTPMCVQMIWSNYFGVMDNRPHKAVILERRESIVVRSIFTLAFCLESLSKLGHKKVESKERVTALLGAGNRDWRLALLRWWEFEGQNARNEKVTWRSSRNMPRDLFVFGWILNCPWANKQTPKTVQTANRVLWAKCRFWWSQSAGEDSWVSNQRKELAEYSGKTSH